MRQNLLSWFDSYYFVLMFPLALLVIWLNYYGEGMQGIIGHYLEFKHIILAGFDPSVDRSGTPTFPMWGYGWVFLLTENKTAILLAQSILGIGAVHFFIRTVAISNLLARPYLRLFKFIIVFSLPVYAYHSLLWPYSIGIILTLISLGLFFRAHCAEGNKGFVLAAFSGLAFGLMLNFRSDYYLLPPILVFVTLLCYRFRRRFLALNALWLVALYVMMGPWLLYTKKATAHYLLTSTNAGHVLFIGLGILPGNNWGITPYDGDPVMWALVRDKFGKGSSTLSHEANQYLKEQFAARIMEDPVEYLRKVAYSALLMLGQGVYPGEFQNRPECRGFHLRNVRGDISFLRLEKTMQTLGDTVKWAITLHPCGGIGLLKIVSTTFARLVVLFSFLLTPLAIIYALKKRDLIAAVSVVVILYQVAINVFAYHSSTYTGNVYILLTLSAMIAMTFIQQFYSFRIPRLLVRPRL